MNYLINFFSKFRLLKIGFLSLIIIFPASYVFAGSGAGGQIRFINDSDQTVSITFSGVGCFDTYHGLTLVCEAYDAIKPHSKIEYKYNWGVTTTWINVQASRSDWSEKDQNFAPCGIYGDKKKCYLDHHTISTKGYSWSEYTYKDTKSADELQNNLKQTLLTSYESYIVEAIHLDSLSPNNFSYFLYPEQTNSYSRYNTNNISKHQLNSWIDRMPAFELISSIPLKIDGSKSSSIPTKVTVQNEIYLSGGHNELSNHSSVSQTLTTPVYTKAVSRTTKTSTSNTVNVGVSNTTSVEGKANILVADAKASNSTTVSASYNFSTTNEVTDSVTETFTMPSQDIIVPAGCYLIVDTTLAVGEATGKFQVMVPFVNDPWMTQYISLPPDFKTTMHSKADITKMFVMLKNANKLNNSLLNVDNLGNLNILLTGDYYIKTGLNWKVIIDTMDITPNSCRAISNNQLTVNGAKLTPIKKLNEQFTNKQKRTQQYVYYVENQKK